MTDLFRKLELPANRIKDLDLIRSIRMGKTLQKYAVIFNPYDVLSDELIDIFNKLHLKLDFITVFYGGPSISISHKWMHRDVAYDALQKKWKILHCGINWEFTNSYSRSVWVDPRNLIEIEPPDIYKFDPALAKLAGNHFSKAGLSGIPPEGEILGEVTISKDPVLFRTNLPHITEWTSLNPTRQGISIRFEEEWDSWEEAVERFRPLFSS